ncbi:hypothetical protein HYU16_01115 [Candidatus Woesearchaeota archaeon]|nr:hypothetical protein [Candidatus Woesearchaeota archaeon]
MKNSFKSGFVMFIIVSIAVLLMATASYAQAQGGSTSGCGDGICMNVGCLTLNCAAPETWENCPQDCPASCHDGFKNQDETGIDCGGNCFEPTKPEWCDGFDNNKDCMVDANCTAKSGIGPGGAVTQPVSPLPAPKQPEPGCYDGHKNQDELSYDCGGVCVIDIPEVCDNKDNDRDCQVDEGNACSQETQQEATEQPVIVSATPEVLPAPVPVSAPVPAPESQPEPGTPLEVPATPAKEMPAIGDSDISSLTDGELDAFIEQNGGADFIKQVKKLAEEKGIYVPKEESDVQFGRKYVLYFFKHQSELAAEFEGKERTEADFVNLLRHFSEEAYPNPEPRPQAQGFFSKVKSFFKRLFG